MGENWRIRGGTAMCDTLSCTLTRGPSPLFWSRLREVGVLREKHIPPSYLRAGYDQRLQLLQGLMDSDGYIAPETGTAEFTSTSEVLAEGTFELVLSLGQKATLLKGDATLYGIRVSDKWRVRYSPTIVAVSLPRKVGCLQPHLDRRRQADVPRTGQRYIKSIEQIGKETHSLRDCRLVQPHDAGRPAHDPGSDGWEPWERQVIPAVLRRRTW